MTRSRPQVPRDRLPVANQWQSAWLATAPTCAQLRADKRKLLIYNDLTYTEINVLA